MNSRPINLPFMLLSLILVTSIILSGSGIASAGDLSASMDAAKVQQTSYNPEFYESDIINVIFHDELRIRLRGETLVDLDNNSLNNTAAQEVLNAIPEGSIEPTFQAGEAALDKQREQAEQLSGEPMPDLNNSYRIEIPDGMSLDEAIEFFSQMEGVAGVFPIPKPVPPPAPPDYGPPIDANFDENLNRNVYQRYLDAAPDGLDFRFAASGLGGKGKEVKICDVEYGWNDSHADLPPVILVGPAPAADIPSSWLEHGTAVLGQLGALDNGWGITGMVPAAKLYFAASKTSLGGWNIASAVNQCISVLSAGDVILIEQQIAGPNAGAGQIGLVAAEWDINVFNAIKTATALGITVVEAAGNGSENLDSADYSPVSGMGSHHPFKPENDSGAIIVGSANSAYDSTPRSRRSSSNYGSTVDLQGWGMDIVTTGYGAYYSSEGVNLFYTHTFGGTSGASPMVAAAVTVLQSNHKLKSGQAESPADIKSLLQATGTPQQGTENIGPQPDLRAALYELWSLNPLNAPLLSPGSGIYSMPMQVTIDYGSGQSSSDTHIRYSLDGSDPSPDSFIFNPDFGDTLYLNYGATVKAKSFQSDTTSGLILDSETAEAEYISSTPKVETPNISPGGGVYNQGQQFVITTNTPGATIRYRTDGRAPSFFYPGTQYTGPITLSPGSHEIVARGYKDGYYKSDAAYSGDITINPLTLPPPTLYPNGGNYNGEVTVYMGSTVLGAEIRYTLDGSDPTNSSALYIEPFTLTASATVKARIYLDGYTESEVTSASFTVLQKAANPIITPDSGTTANDNLTVTITNNTPGAVVRYTLNGAEPTSYSTIYDVPIQLTDGVHTVKARAYLTGALPSDTVTASYTVYDTSVPISQPVIEPNSGIFNGPITVTMSTDVEVDLIFYTLDGTDPQAPPIGTIVYPYNGPFQLFGDDTYYLRARAYVDGIGNSEMTFGQLTVVTPTLGTVETPTITPPGGQFTNTVAVEIDAPDFNPPFFIRRLFYTTDGTDPEVNFESAGVGIPSNLNISNPTTVKAIAGQAGYFDSQIASAEFTFICATPEITPASGVFTDTVEVALSTGTIDSTIFYTTDGSEPTQLDAEYNAPFTLGVGIHTIKAKCYKDNYLESEAAVAVLPVLPTPVAPVILTQPAGQTVDAGTPVTLTVEAAGIPDPDYQWTRDGIPLAGETESELLIPAAALSNAGDYQVIVSNQAGEVTSQLASLVVNPINVELSIQKEAHASSVAAGERITYTLTMVNNASVPVLAQIEESLSPVAAVAGLSDSQGVCSQLVDGVATCTTSLVANGTTQLSIYVDTNESYTGLLTNIATIDGTDGFVNVNTDNSSGPVIVSISAGGGGQVGSIYLPLVVQTSGPAQASQPVRVEEP